MMLAEIVISDYWVDRIELLFMFTCGVALGWMLRILWERDR